MGRGAHLYTYTVHGINKKLTVLVEGLISNPFPDGLTRFSLIVSRHLEKFDIDLVFIFPMDVTFHPHKGEEKRVWLPANPLRLRSWFRFLYLQSEFPRLVKKFDHKRPDVILHTGPEASLFSSVPQVLVIHDINPLLFPRYNPRLYFYYRYMLPRIFRKVDLVVTVSHTTERELIAHYEEFLPDVRVVPNGVDHDLFTPGGKMFEPEKERILYVGALRPMKGIEILFLAFAHLKGQISTELWIAGKGETSYVSLLKKLAKDLGIEKRIRWLGTPSDEELAAIMRGSLLFVFPSLYEGFGLPVLEAMASGVPVIVSDITALKEITGGKAQYFSPGSWLSLAKIIEKVLGDDNLRRKMIDDGLENSRNYSWEKTAQMLYQLLLRYVKTF